MSPKSLFLSKFLHIKSLFGGQVSQHPAAPPGSRILPPPRVPGCREASGRREEVFVRRLYGVVSPWPPVPTVKMHHTKTSRLSGAPPPCFPHPAPPYLSRHQRESAGAAAQSEGAAAISVTEERRR